MGFYKKKPVVIEAVQYTGDNPTEVNNLLGGILNLDEGFPGLPIIIETLEGDMRADVGDWIICGVKGEFYPCKPDIFDATYEAVE